MRAYIHSGIGHTDSERVSTFRLGGENSLRFSCAPGGIRTRVCLFVCLLKAYSPANRTRSLTSGLFTNANLTHVTHEKAFSPTFKKKTHKQTKIVFFNLINLN